MTNPLSELDQDQARAASVLSGPLLVLAGAGSGKTRTVVHRIAHLLQTRTVKPGQVLAVTFTNKAAGEMARRLERLLGSGPMPPDRRPLVTTFHALCARVLRRFGSYLGLSPDYTIYDDADSKKLIRRLVKEHDLWGCLPPASARYQIDRLKNAGVRAGDPRPLRSRQEEVLDKVYRAYQAAVRRANAVDFSDLLLNVDELLQNEPAVLEACTRRWRTITVDEFQDTNLVQYRLVKALAGDHRNLCAVGDDDQSIYGWRGATVANILEFDRDFPDAQVVTLGKNYRSSARIVKAANGVISHNRGRRPKEVWTDNEEGELVVGLVARGEQEEAVKVADELLRLFAGGKKAREIAVFYRTNAQSRLFEEAFATRGVPFQVVGGVGFYQRKEIKDTVAYLRVLLNPRDDEAFERIVNVPPRGIGKKSIERLRSGAAQEDCSLTEAARLGLPGAPGARLKEFIAWLDRLGETARDDKVEVGGLVATILHESGYYAALQEGNDPEGRDRLDNLNELINAAHLHDLEEVERPLAAFLERAGLRSEVDGLEEGAAADLIAEGSQDLVSLMTCHNAKGLEFPVVFVVGVEEGLLPHERSITPEPVPVPLTRPPEDGGPPEVADASTVVYDEEAPSPDGNPANPIGDGPAGTSPPEDGREDDSKLEEERRLFYVSATRARERLYLCCSLRRRVMGSSDTRGPSRFLGEVPAEVMSWRGRKPVLHGVMGQLQGTSRPTGGRDPPAPGADPAEEEEGAGEGGGAGRRLPGGVRRSGGWSGDRDGPALCRGRSGAPSDPGGGGGGGAPAELTQVPGDRAVRWGRAHQEPGDSVPGEGLTHRPGLRLLARSLAAEESPSTRPAPDPACRRHHEAQVPPSG